MSLGKVVAPKPLGARAELRIAIKRLMTAIAKPCVTTTVFRRDIEILLCASTKHVGVSLPNLHPAQE